MTNKSVETKQKQFGKRLLLIAFLVIAIFGIWYAYQKMTISEDGMARTEREINEHALVEHDYAIPGDDLREYKEFLHLAAEKLMQNQFEAEDFADNYSLYFNLEDQVYNKNEYQIFWQEFTEEYGNVLPETIEYQVLGNGVKITFKTDKFNSDSDLFRRQLAFVGYEKDQQLLLAEDVINKKTDQKEYQSEILGVGDFLPETMFASTYFKGEIAEVNVAEKTGKWKLLFFYPADFTTVCPTECLALREFHQEFVDLNTEVYAISTDPVAIHQAWVEKYFGPLPYALVSDVTGELSKTFNFWSNQEGVALRGTVIVNDQNQIMYMAVNENNTGRNIDEYLRAIIAMQAPGLKVVDWQNL